MDRDDQDWKAFLADDETALRKLMERFYGPLLNYGSKYSKSKEVIKDCIQELFIDLWFQRHQVAQPHSVKAYLLISLRRRLARKLSKASVLRLSDQPVDDEKLFYFESSPELLFIERESIVRQAQRVAEYLNELPRRQREIVYLKYYQNLTREEIAEVMGISHQSVSNLLQKALYSLRQVVPHDLSFILLGLSVADQLFS
ncbi:sigma-70 family RNA polymerase sigma factor [Rhabdobacter roseus]|uniref:RNA polymerase sigma factor (Sigma-70 family) n=1 Tax=Rhabdobacter roseus TaxID=1655419 RepID=A0A840TRD7_9BACT|nr:sigma-70 family RNA polymerase sigma factor [Rhabdobacter roseus]MBB5285485.1 RNA polymerase sigma factor (sigma-70 family) [Rhabdobacter roseus]